MNATSQTISQYVRNHVRFETAFKDGKTRAVLLERFEKAFSVLPPQVADLFLSDGRNLVVIVMPDLELPLGMRTRSEGPPEARTYTIVVFREHGEWSENHFIGAFLRELGHVVAQRPPESEWPTTRGDRSRFREKLEYRADAMVWRWGLRHYSMSHLTATYPPHWVERIVTEIGKIVLEENDSPWLQ